MQILCSSPNCLLLVKCLHFRPHSFVEWSLWNSIQCNSNFFAHYCWTFFNFAASLYNHIIVKITEIVRLELWSNNNILSVENDDASYSRQNSVEFYNDYVAGNYCITINFVMLHEVHAWPAAAIAVPELPTTTLLLFILQI